MKYKVGEIFYLVGDENLKVIPFRIVEEITRTNLEGIEKNYIAELPDSKKTRVSVKRLKGKVFEDIRSLKTHMIENAKKAIETMVFDAIAISESVFKTNALKEISEGMVSKEEITLPLNENNNVQNKSNEDIIKIDIGNGVIANMRATDLEKVKSNL